MLCTSSGVFAMRSKTGPTRSNDVLSVFNLKL
jgi:hypothetical protein